MQVLDESSIYSNFIDSIASKFTKASYVNSLKNFMLYLKIDKYSDLVTMPHDQIYDSIKSHILFLRETKMSTRSITIKLYALKCFYDMNEIENIKWKKLKRFRGETSDVNEDRGYTHEEIQQILNVSDLRTKAVVLLMASSGMRVGALPTLRVSHISPKLVTVYAKTPQKYITFITPECKSAIDTYLQFRERCGEKITPESPLLRKEFDIDFPEAARKKVEPITRAGLHRSLYLTLIKSGLRQVDHVNPRARKAV
jgi:site-specific recombinase XerD